MVGREIVGNIAWWAVTISRTDWNGPNVLSACSKLMPQVTMLNMLAISRKNWSISPVKKFLSWSWSISPVKKFLSWRLREKKADRFVENTFFVVFALS